ncbi:MAG TPA: PPOX class F420-dependent oxidoreductase [Streptosporangiaceae bacterium]|jgi:PPOX class probable F420-dependent enzyme
MTALPELARTLFNGANHAVVATIDPGGRPQSSVVWVTSDGDDVLFSTIKGRRKYANLSREPRLSVLVYDPADPYTYAEVRGSAVLTDDPAAELIEQLAVKYTGRPFGERPGEQRVIVRVTPDHVVLYQ